MRLCVIRGVAKSYWFWDGTSGVESEATKIFLRVVEQEEKSRIREENGEAWRLLGEHWEQRMVGRILGVTLKAFVGTVVCGLAVAAFFVGPVFAAGGLAADGQVGLIAPVTEVAREIHSFYDWVTLIVIAIALFVLGLLVFAMWRFSEKNNPTPAQFTHNAILEVLWTVIPIIILVVIAIPSFKLLSLQYDYPKPDLTIKATGAQWYWSYEYPDNGGFTFDSYMLTDEDRQEVIDAGHSAPRNLAVDNDVVVPVGKVVHVLVTASDVIHNWTIPSFGSKVDAVPGRVTATWFKADEEGIYYGQCSELCGKDHAFMPIAVHVVSEDKFNAWVAARQDEDDDKAKEILQQATLERTKKRDVALVEAENRD